MTDHMHSYAKPCETTLSTCLFQQSGEINTSLFTSIYVKPHLCCSFIPDTRSQNENIVWDTIVWSIAVIALVLFIGAEVSQGLWGSGLHGVGSSQEWGEQRVWSLLQHIWTVQLYSLSDITLTVSLGLASHTLYLCIFAFVSYLSFVHDQNTICVQHSVDTMGDGEHGALLEGFFDGVLDQSVRLCVDGCRRLVQKNNLLTNRRDS